MKNDTTSIYIPPYRTFPAAKDYRPAESLEDILRPHREMYKNPVTRWLMGESKPTTLEPILCAIAMATLVFWMVWSATA